MFILTVFAVLLTHFTHLPLLDYPFVRFHNSRHYLTSIHFFYHFSSCVRKLVRQTFFISDLFSLLKLFRVKLVEFSSRMNHFYKCNYSNPPIPFMNLFSCNTSSHVKNFEKPLSRMMWKMLWNNTHRGTLIY